MPTLNSEAHPVILSVSGDGVIITPSASLRDQKSQVLQAFVEKEDFTLTANLDISDPTNWFRDRLDLVPAGTTITSVYIFLNPLLDPAIATATFSFGGEILGVIGNRDDLEFTNSLLGLDGTEYLGRESLENNDFTGEPDQAIINENQLELRFANREGKTLNSQDVIRVILDINEPPGNISLSNSTVEENLTDAVIGDLSATDAENHTISFNTLDPRFEIIGNQLKLKAESSLNAESETPETVEIIATDDGIPNKSTVQSFTLNVTDVVEAPTDLILSNNSLDENQSIGTLVGVFTAVDQDRNDSHIYSLTTGTGDTNNSSFEIIGNQLRSRETFDRETQASYSIRVLTQDQTGLTVEKVLTIDVNNIDEAPEVQTEISDIGVREDANNTTIDLSNVFTDIDNDDLSITQAIQTNSNPTLVGANLTGNTLVLDYQPDQNGVAEITIAATSNGKTITDTFQITVTPEDDGPRIQTPIQDIAVDEDASNTTINLSEVFIDIDSENAGIIQTIQANSNSDLVIASIAGNTLTLDYQDDQTGTAEITVEAISNGLSITDSFTVTVNPVADPPTAIALDVSSVAENQEIDTVVGRFETTDVDLGDSYSYRLVPGDGDTDNNRFRIVGRQLRTQEIFDFETQDSYSIRVETQDSQGLILEAALTINVENLEDAIILSSSLGELVLNEDPANTIIDLSGVFIGTDPNNPVNLRVITNTNPDLVETNLTGENLTLAFQENATGSAEITLEATANGQIITDTFQVIVNPVDDGPEVVNKIPDINVNEDTVNTLLDLSQTFTDIDSPGVAITKSVKSNSNSDLVEVSISGDTLTLDYQKDQSGTAEITIEANTNGQTTMDTFVVTVNPVNDTPDFVSIAPTSAAQDQIYVYTVVARDPDVQDPGSTERLTITGVNLPATWLSLRDNRDGTASLTGTPTGEEVGVPQVIELQVQDDSGAFGTQRFTINVDTVNQVPIFAGVPATEVNEGSFYQFTPTAFDPEGDGLSFFIQNQPDWASFNFATGELQGTPGAGDIGTTQNIVIGVSDGASVQELAAFDIIVNNVNDAPTDIILTGNNISENQVGATVGEITVVDPDSTSFSYDVSDSRFEIVADQLKLRAGISLDHETEPAVELIITVTDTDALSLSESFTVFVNDVEDGEPSPTPTPTPIPTPGPTPGPIPGPTPARPISIPRNSSPSPSPGTLVEPDGEATVTLPTPTPRPNPPNLPASLIENGFEEDDVLFGTPESDVLDGLAGDDELFGLAADDNLLGNLGNDFIVGNQGNDFIDGGEGDDQIFGGKENDTLLGNTGEDIQFGDIGEDLLLGEADRDQMFGNQDNDELQGGASADDLFGGQGNDFVVGGIGDDLLLGDLGNDTLSGVDPQAANPGQGEVDILEGGQGEDWFVLGNQGTVYYDDGDNTTSGQSDYALINAFNLTEDLIVLAGAASQYLLNPIAINGVTGTGIYLDSNSSQAFDSADELIAILKDVTLDNNAGNLFRYGI